MRTALIIAVFCVICPLQGAFGAETGIVIDMGKIAFIESSGCKNMIGDNGKALGCYQLHAGVVTDYNKAHKTAYKHKDVMKPDIGLQIASWYMGVEIPRLLKHYKQPITLETKLSAWNMGVGNVVKGKRASKYIEKYSRIK